MGANSRFTVNENLKTEDEALKYAMNLIDQSRYEDGHGSYNGSWGAASGARFLRGRECATPEEAERLLVGGFSGDEKAYMNAMTKPIQPDEVAAWKLAVASDKTTDGQRSWIYAQREKAQPPRKWVKGICEKWGPILIVKMRTGGYAFGAVCAS
jgi:hypothetical protein